MGSRFWKNELQTLSGVKKYEKPKEFERFTIWEFQTADPLWSEKA